MTIGLHRDDIGTGTISGARSALDAGQNMQSIFKSLTVAGPLGRVTIEYDATTKHWRLNTVHVATDSPGVAGMRIAEASGLDSHFCLELAGRIAAIAHTLSPTVLDRVAPINPSVRQFAGVVPQPFQFESPPTPPTPPPQPQPPSLVGVPVVGGVKIPSAQLVLTPDKASCQLVITRATGEQRLNTPLLEPRAGFLRGLFYVLNGRLPGFGDADATELEQLRLAVTRLGK